MRFVALTLLLAACSRTPDYSACRLVGTWESLPTRSEFMDKMAREHGRDPNEVWTEAVETLRSKGAIPTTRYERDGTYIQAGVVLDHAIEDRSTWRVIESTPERIVIGIADRNSPNDEEIAAFVFESDDTIRHDDGLLKGTKLYRIRTAK